MCVYFYLVNIVDMWGLVTCSREIFESCIIRPLRLNLRVISAVNHSIYCSLSTVCFLMKKILRIQPSEIDAYGEGDFSSLVQ